MKLYHGSNVAFKDIDLSLCRPNKAQERRTQDDGLDS